MLVWGRPRGSFRHFFAKTLAALQQRDGDGYELCSQILAETLGLGRACIGVCASTQKPSIFAR
jgi:hypothetical protein